MSLVAPSQLESTLAVKNGSDARVFLCERFARKRFHTQRRYDQELLALRTVSSGPSIVSIVDVEPEHRTLIFTKYKVDLLHVLMGEEQVPIFDRAFWVGLLSALSHCHSCRIVHRDVKLDNILLDDQYNPVLCDFSRAVSLSTPTSMPFEGTRRYAAPEALEGVCWFSNDVWSAGVVLYCVLERSFPFDSTTEQTGSDGDIKRPLPNENLPYLEFSSERWDSALGAQLQVLLLKRILEPHYPARISSLQACRELESSQESCM